MARALDNQHRRTLILSGAVLGAFVGPLGLWLDVRPKLGAAVSEKFGTIFDMIGRAGPLLSLDAGPTGLLVLAVPFVGTLILMPRFVRWLETQVERERVPFYSRAGLGGVVFGAVATALITWGLLMAAVIAGTIQNAGSTAPGDSAGAIVGTALIFGPLAGLSTPFLFIPSIIVLGIPFGLIFGMLVRRLATAA
jgi:hypothetical protein